jgi:hypothetical protein
MCPTCLTLPRRAKCACACNGNCQVQRVDVLQDGIAISADVREWERQEAARKAAALAKVMQFKTMRESQVKEKEQRLQLVGSQHLSFLSRDNLYINLWRCGIKLRCDVNISAATECWLN